MIGNAENKNQVIKQADSLKRDYDQAYLEHGATEIVLSDKTDRLRQLRLAIDGYRNDTDTQIENKIGCLAAHILSLEYVAIERDVRSLSHTVELSRAAVDTAFENGHQHYLSNVGDYIEHASAYSPDNQQSADSQVA